MKTSYVLPMLALLFLSLPKVRAQVPPPAWQWGIRGGGSFDEGSVGGQSEEVTDIATDPAGNVYVLSQVFFNYNVDVTIDTFLLDVDSIGRGSVLSSFTCDGEFRWAKAFGNRQGGSPAALECDTLGGVYVAMNHSHYNWYEPLVVDVDTHLTWYSYKRMQLLKYDTAGNFQWIREPQPDTMTWFSTWTGGLDLDVDGGGNIWFYAMMGPGAYFDGAMSVPEKGLYVSHLDQDANYIGSTRLDVDLLAAGDCCTPFTIGTGKAWLVRNHQTGMLYTGGVRPYLSDDSTRRFAIGGTEVPAGQGIFIASFSPDGSSNWVQGNTDTAYGHSLNCGLSRAVLDGSGNLYFAGAASKGDTIAGMPVENPATNFPIGTVMAFKLDSAGNGMWLTNSINQYSAYGFECGGALRGQEFILGAGHSHWMTWPGLGDTLTKDPDGFLHIHMARFDTATGSIIGVDSLQPTVTVKSDRVTSLHTDRFGNTYVGGSMAYTLIVAGDTLYEAPSGDKEFFIAQYGAGNCSTVIDTPSTAVHPGSPAVGALRVYPNPTAGEVALVCDCGDDRFAITTTDGRTVATGHFRSGKASLNIAALPSGLYVVRVANGAVRKLIKE